MGRLVQAVLGIVFLSPLLLIGLWCYLRPQDSANRIWLRYIGYSLFGAYAALVIPFFFPLPSTAFAQTLGRGVGGLLGLWLVVSWFLSRRQFRKLSNRTNPRSQLRT